MWLSEDEVEVWLAFALAGVGARVGAGLGFAGSTPWGGTLGLWALGVKGGRREGRLRGMLEGG